MNDRQQLFYGVCFNRELFVSFSIVQVIREFKKSVENEMQKECENATLVCNKKHLYNHSLTIIFLCYSTVFIQWPNSKLTNVRDYHFANSLLSLSSETYTNICTNLCLTTLPIKLAIN